MTGHPPDDGVFRLLLMCTANQCRSPMAEVIARHRLDALGVDAEVVSAGALPGGSAAAAGALRAVRRRDLDLRDHLSRQVDAETLDAASLVLTMERRHVVTVAELSLAAVGRTFTLVELASLSGVVGPRRRGQSVSSWIIAANRARAPESVMSHGTDDDVDDPMGGSTRQFRQTAEQIDTLLGTVFDALFGSSSDV